MCAGKRGQDSDGSMNAVGQRAEIIADEDDALLAHQRAEEQDEALHVEAGDQRR